LGGQFAPVLGGQFEPVLGGQFNRYMQLVPQKGNYNIEVSLNKGMITSYNKTIEYKPEMQGQADIITDNKTVLARIFNQFRKLIEK
jgi:hypothetical protein